MILKVDDDVRVSIDASDDDAVQVLLFRGGNVLAGMTLKNGVTGVHLWQGEPLAIVAGLVEAEGRYFLSAGKDGELTEINPPDVPAVPDVQLPEGGAE